MKMKNYPNILWYCSDQQRFDTIGALGNPHVHTPRLDQFIKSSVSFTHAYCQSPICTPSRASFLTGCYPSTLGVNGNGNEFFPKHFENRLIGHILSNHGYDCGLVGKLHLASPVGGGGVENRVEDGYRIFEYSHHPKGPSDFGHSYAEWLNSQGLDPKKIIPNTKAAEEYRLGAKLKTHSGIYEPTPEEDNVPPQLHQTHWCTEKAKDFIDKNRRFDQPWMLSINPFDPHPPFDAPWEYYKRFNPEELPGAHFKESDLAHQKKLQDAGVDFQSEVKHPEERDHKKIQASYYAMIEQIDHEFGRLLDYLDSIGERENTIVFFMSDHGESLNDHGLIAKGCRLYEGSIRVPLIISYLGEFQQNIVSSSLVELLDIVPTIFEMLGIEQPYYMQGKSLLSILNGTSPSKKHRDFVRTEFYGAIDFPDQTHATMYRDERWKLVWYHRKNNLCELYDLDKDPWEHHDLSNDPNYESIRWELVQKCFDESAFIHQPDPPRVNPF